MAPQVRGCEETVWENSSTPQNYLFIYYIPKCRVGYGKTKTVPHRGSPARIFQLISARVNGPVTQRTVRFLEKQSGSWKNCSYAETVSPEPSPADRRPARVPKKLPVAENCFVRKTVFLNRKGFFFYYRGTGC